MPTILNICLKGRIPLFCTLLIFPLLNSYSANMQIHSIKLLSADTIGTKTLPGYEEVRKEWEKCKNEVVAKQDSLIGAIHDIDQEAKSNRWNAKKYSNALGDLPQRLVSLNATIINLNLLDSSIQHYRIKDLEDVDSGKAETLFNIQTCEIEFHVEKNNMASFVHETTHGALYERQEIAYLWGKYVDSVKGLLQSFGNDYGDEVEAYRAQFAFDRASVCNLSSSSKAKSFRKITENWVKNLTMGNDTPYKPGGFANIAIVHVNVDSRVRDLKKAYPDNKFFITLDDTFPASQFGNIIYKGKRDFICYPIALDSSIHHR